MKTRTFAIGDIHGCFDSFHKLVEHKIELKKNEKLILLGDYIDRGAQSKAVIDYIMGLRNRGFDITPLMGNHESMLLDAFDNNMFLAQWIINGATETLKSFRINSINELDQTYIDFFRSLKFYHSFENFLFVHAGFNDRADNPFEDKYQMIWECQEKYMHPAFIGKTIIHGHRPVTVTTCKEIIQANQQVINIDTGCVYADKVGYGHLSAIEVYTKELFSV